MTCVSVAGGDGHALACLSDGTIQSWGRNDHGQCDVPVPPPGLAYVAVAAGHSHNLALRNDNQHRRWVFDGGI